MYSLSLVGVTEDQGKFWGPFGGRLPGQTSDLGTDQAAPTHNRSVKSERPSSPTPRAFERYVQELVAPMAQKTAAADGRITKTEVANAVRLGRLSQEEANLFQLPLARGHTASKKQRPEAESVVGHVGRRALAAGKKAAKGDRRISKADALASMPKDLARLFLHARGAGLPIGAPAPELIAPTPGPSPVTAPAVTPSIPENYDGHVMPVTRPPLSAFAGAQVGSAQSVADLVYTPLALSPAAQEVVNTHSIFGGTFAHSVQVSAAQMQKILSDPTTFNRKATVLGFIAWGYDTSHAANDPNGYVVTPLPAPQVAEHLAGKVQDLGYDQGIPHNIDRLRAAFQWFTEAARLDPSTTLHRFQTHIDAIRFHAVMAVSPDAKQVHVFGWSNKNQLWRPSRSPRTPLAEAQRTTRSLIQATSAGVLACSRWAQVGSSRRSKSFVISSK